ncbi:hypothetical protein [Vibrio hyugaensis]|nr:hypothetical protein [Vibrio hyugaensis]
MMNNSRTTVIHHDSCSDVSLFEMNNVFIKNQKYKPFSGIEQLARFINIKLKRIKTVDNYLLLKSADVIKNADVFICTDLIVGKRIKEFNPNCKVVWALHGAVANSFMNSVDTDGVDLILSCGETTTNAVGSGFNGKIVEVGSVKLHSCKSNDKKVSKIELFGNENRTVLYNPHFNNKIGARSWDDHGIELLDWFKNNSDFNLIFSPHPMLVKKIDESILSQYKTDNIHIDLGGSRSMNMSYEPVVDVYIGDVSSHALEYMSMNQRTFVFHSNQDLSNESTTMHKHGRTFNSFDEFSSELLNKISENEAEIQKRYISTVFSPVTNPCSLSASVIMDLL